jgi:hypothetical protein
MPSQAPSRTTLPERKPAVNTRGVTADERHLLRYAKAVIKFVNHWQNQLKANEGKLVLYVLTETYGRGGSEWALVPKGLMSRSHRSEAANRLEGLGLIQRSRFGWPARTRWKVDLDVLFGEPCISTHVRHSGHQMFGRANIYSLFSRRSS